MATLESEVYKPNQEASSCFWHGIRNLQRDGKPDNRIASGSDSELAKEMNELSVQERENILEEIHGIRSGLEETPESNAESLRRLDGILGGLHPRKRKAYDRALFLNPSLQNNTKEKLMFLRADLHDAEKASKRMLKYYEDKRALFGEEKLGRDITFEDLNEEDLKMTEFGSALVLPDKDPTGRPVLFFNMSHADPAKVTNMLRFLWYVIMSSLEDDTVQLRGSCIIDCFFKDLFAIPSLLSGATGVVMKAGEICRNLPLRPTSYHFCYSNPRMSVLLNTVRIAFGKEVRLRLRAHFGSELEIQYSLMAFGINCKNLFGSGYPYEQKPTMLQEQFLERRREIERKRKEHRIRREDMEGLVCYPRPKDVLIGRGRPHQEHYGNLLMSQLVDARMDIYHTGDRFGKTCVTMEIVQHVRDSGGRFLQRTAVGWKVLNDKVAREKMASVFRTKALKNASEMGIRY